eukprot:CAMPEP_0114688562 /NCGR_PEP_ID=MMETSP0191-20121206/63599_1 /TAXON_ID=126664 /ORGANISM="Sorites sp." /LENGTH=185 /DNA_ID=CAMNT_0001976163 /DNA_START=156 /DNA_END=713 /DNA_ORIENTATION=+
MGLQMAEMTLQTACTNVQQAITTAAQDMGPNDGPEELAQLLGTVFTTMQKELDKGVNEVKLGLKMQGLTTSLEDLKGSMDIANENIAAMEKSCGFKDKAELATEISQCKKTTSEAKQAMVTAFSDWIKSAAAELLSKVVPWDQSQMKKFNAEKIPEITAMVSSMCDQLQTLVDSAGGAVVKKSKA